MALYKRAANLAAKADESAEVSETSSESRRGPLYEALGTAREGVQRLLAAAVEQLPPWDLRDPPPATLTGLSTPSPRS